MRSDLSRRQEKGGCPDAGENPIIVQIGAASPYGELHRFSRGVQHVTQADFII